MPQPPSPPPPPRPAGSWRVGLQQKFGLAFLVLILLAVGNVAVIHGMLQRLDGVAETVNVAGRLRMLSQKIAYELASSLRRSQPGDAIAATLGEYEQGLSALERGGPAYGLPTRRLPPEMWPLVSALREHWNAYRTQVLWLYGRHGAPGLPLDALDAAGEASARLLQQAEALVAALTQDARQTQARMLVQLHALLAAQLLVLAVLALLLRRRVVNPLRELVRHNRQLAAGHYATRVEFQSGDEIGELTEAFNFASQKLGELAAQNAQDSAVLRQTQAMFLGLAENAILGICIIQDEKFLFVNPRMAEMFGYERERMTASVSLFDIFDEADHAIVREQVQKRLNGEASSVIYEARGRTCEGTVIDLEIHGAVMEIHGRPATIGAMLDVTARHADQIRRDRQYVEKLQYLATHDGLTGLANRNLLLDRLRQATAIARRSGQLVAVLLLDLNQFKIVNDSLGHPTGDALLKTVANRLRTLMRESDTVARLGGDEFVVLLPSVAQAAEAAQVAEKILGALSAPFAIQTRQIHVGASIGIGLYPQDGEGSELIKSADLAMYHAKQEGRGKFHFYSEEMSTHNQRHMELEAELRHALARGELSLVYQPKLNLRTRRIEGAEALLRWRHPRLGSIPPAEFVPLAEQTGLIIPIGEWVLQTACAQNRAWQGAGLPPLAVAINLSARQFRGSDLVSLVGRVLEQTGLAPQCLELELTESAFVQHTEETAAALSSLKASGVRLSLDDFGTGYSALNYLRHFPFDTLKLDRSFISDVSTSPHARTLTEAIIALAHHLKLQVVAEGIETQAQFAFLRANRCDEGQGYYLSVPLPPERFFELAMEPIPPLPPATAAPEPGERSAQPHRHMLVPADAAGARAVAA